MFAAGPAGKSCLHVSRPTGGLRAPDLTTHPPSTENRRVAEDLLAQTGLPKVFLEGSCPMVKRWVSWELTWSKNNDKKRDAVAPRRPLASHLPPVPSGKYSVWRRAEVCSPLCSIMTAAGLPLTFSNPLRLCWVFGDKFYFPRGRFAINGTTAAALTGQTVLPAVVTGTFFPYLFCLPPVSKSWRFDSRG